MTPAISKDRIIPGAAAVALQLTLGYALVVGLGVVTPPTIVADLKVFDVARDKPVPPPPPPRPKPQHARAPKPRGAAAPPALHAHATPVVAPPPVIRIERPPLIVAAPLPGIGADASAGAAVAGPGSGSGGEGSGTGSGSSGSGEGGGGGSHAEYLRGTIRGDRDYPRAAKAAGIGGELTTRYLVGTDGRVKTCAVTRSSGNAELDATTCRLVVERFRYAPARDATGRKVTDIVIDEHRWGVRDAPGPDEPPDGPPR